MMKKRIISAILLICMLTAVSCGGSGSTNDTTSSGDTSDTSATESPWAKNIALAEANLASLVDKYME